MIIKRLAPLHATVVVIALAIAMAVGSVITAPTWSAPAGHVPNQPNVQLGSTPTASLARPVPNPTGIKAYSSVAYVHQANCQNALTGANGDNDVARYMGEHASIYAWGWQLYVRYSNTRFVQFISFYWRNGVGSSVEAGYCMGDDSSITDSVQNAPAGW